MSVFTLSSATKPFVPLRMTQRSMVVQAAAVLAATGVLTACSWMSVPMIPVPITMQTFGVTLVAALFGSRLGTLAILAWLMEAAVGLPVLSGGHAGLGYMVGPTGGYLVAFVLTGLFVGAAAERGWTARSVPLALLVMLTANAMILAVGGLWLMTFIGAEQAIALGITPFLLGGFLKAGLAACSIEAARRHLPVR